MNKKGVIIGVIVVAIIAGLAATYSSSTSETVNLDMGRTHGTISTAMGSPILGNLSAPITIVEFGDYQCERCYAWFHETKPAIVQDYIDTGKAQEPNLGRTVIQKLEQEAAKCTSAVIVMTGEDMDADGNLRARENVLHEIGYVQSEFGLRAVCVLHEEGTNIPSNIHGLVYIPFPKDCVEATFGALTRELNTFYGL